jgi:Concanavalin A-like lectin/glucanases superfamily/Glycoside hydrolase 123, catalytic domain/Glycoside hydrolase 123 N-terminal domain
MNRRCNKMLWMILFVIIEMVSHSLNANEVLWLKFNEGSGSIVYDSSSSQNDGTVYGPIWTAGKYEYGGGLEFNGDNGYIRYGSDSSLQITEDWSISYWIKPKDGHSSADGYEYIFMSLFGGTSYIRLHSNGNMHFAFASDSGYFHYSSFKNTWNEEWYYITFTYDKSEGTITGYINGALDKKMTGITGDTIVGTNYSYIGNSTFSLDGIIDEVLIKDRFLSDTEVKNLYTASRRHLSFPLDEGTGSTVYDTSEYGHDGTIYGPTWTTGKYGYGGGLELNGDADYIRYDPGSSLQITGDWSISYWIKPKDGHSSADGYEYIFTSLFGGTSYTRLHSNGNMHFAFASDSGYFHYSSFKNTWNEEWYYITFTYDKSESTITGYINGALDKKMTGITGNTIVGTNYSYIGNSTFSFDGIIDEVVIEDRFLNGTEVYNLYLTSKQRLSFPFNEANGNTTYDISTYGNNGTIYGADWGEGKSGAAMEFDGVNDDYVDCNTGSSLSFADGEEWLFEVWLKPDANDSWQAFVGKKGFDIYLMLHAGNRLYFKDSNANYCYVNIGDYGGEWLHITVAAYSSGSMTVYRDGEYKGTMTPSSTAMNFNYIGCSGNKNRKFKGIIDEVKLFAIADFTSPQVAFASSTPVDSATITQTSVTISVTVNEPASKVILNWNGKEVEMTGTYPNYSITQTDLAGNYNYKVYAYDLAGYIGETSERILYADNSDDITIWTLNNLVRVKKDKSPIAGNLYGSVSIKAAKNEYEPFQIVVSARGMDRALSNVNISISNLTNSSLNTFSNDNFKFYREHYVEISTSSPSSPNGPDAPGWYPDALIPFKNPYTGNSLSGATYDAVPFTVASEQNQPIWVEVCVPKTAVAGTYTGTITVSADNENNVQIPITLKIWNFTLPERATQKSLFGLIGSAIADCYNVTIYSSAYIPYEELYCKFMIQHRIMPKIPYATCPNRNSDGTLDFTVTRGTKTVGEWLEYYFDDLHVTSMSNWYAHWYSHDGDEYDNTRYDYSATTNNLNYITNVYTSMYNYYQTNGWADRLYLYIKDEPNSAQAYANINDRADFLHNINSEFNLLVTEQPEKDDPSWESMVGFVDTWCPLVGLFNYTDVAARLAAGDEVWSYTVNTQDNLHPGVPKWYLDYPVINYRINSWINGYCGANGILKSPFTFPNSNPSSAWTNPTTSNGELYPGTTTLVGFDGPVATIRLKQLREGAEDYEYFKILRDLNQETFLSTQIGSVATGWSWANGEWSDSPDDLLTAREAMGNKIEELLNL